MYVHVTYPFIGKCQKAEWQIWSWGIQRISAFLSSFVPFSIREISSDALSFFIHATAHRTTLAIKGCHENLFKLIFQFMILFTNGIFEKIFFCALYVSGRDQFNYYSWIFGKGRYPCILIQTNVFQSFIINSMNFWLMVGFINCVTLEWILSWKWNGQAALQEFVRPSKQLQSILISLLVRIDFATSSLNLFPYSFQFNKLQ